MRQAGGRDGAGRAGRAGRAERAGGREAGHGRYISRLASVLAISALSILLGPTLAVDAAEPPPEPKPVNTEAPKLTGTPAVGQTLSCSQGGWANNPTGYTYAWLRNDSAIAGQAGSTYVVQSADRGTSISCLLTASNSGGEYTISGLRSGSYKVDFFSEEEAPIYQPQYYSGKSSSSEAGMVSVTVPNKTPGIDAALAVGGRISGKATASSGGAALAKIEVCAEQESAGGLGGGCASTNAAGEYTITGLPNGSYAVEFNSYAGGNYLPALDHGVSVSAPGTTASVNAALASGGQISGIVTAESGGAPLANIEVCVKDNSSCATTNTSGEYTLSQLASGEYEVEFSREFSGGNYLEQTRAHVKVSAPSTTSPVNAALASGGQIEGTVTAHGGAPLANVQVCAEGTGNCAFTNAGGVYTIPGLAAGSYEVLFYGSEAGNYAPQYYENKPSRTGDKSVAVTVPNTTKDINAEMHPGAQITGKVTAASSGAELANILVCLSGPWFACSPTSAGGEYTFPALPGGSYKLEFLPGESESFEFHESPNYLSQSQEGVSVAAESTRSGVNAALASGGQISGIVTAASGGGGLAKIEVCAEGPEGPSGSGCALTNGGGGSASATSNALAVPAPNSNFSQAKAPVFDAKTGEIDFYFKFADAGTLRWDLSFKNADVGFADSLGLSLGADGVAADIDSTRALAEVTKKKKRKGCKKGTIKHRGKCVHVLVPFSSGSESVPAGTVEVKVHASSKAIKALKAGHTLHVSGPFTFQSALGGAPVTHNVSTVVHWPKKSKKRHGKKR
jgi:hypothetical protein